MPQPRPEFENPPEIFYNAREARKYNVSSRIQKIQRDMTIRALELMNLANENSAQASDRDRDRDGEEFKNNKNKNNKNNKNNAALLLDVGCGSGISGAVLTDCGHVWLGVDISRDMLQIAKEAELQRYFAAGDGDSDGGESDESDEADENDESDGVDVEEEKGEAEKMGEKSGNNRPRKRLRREPIAGYVRFGPIHESDAESASDESVADESAMGPSMVEVLHGDIGHGLPFRPGSFDGCVSISVIQWLCHSSKKGEVPQRRLMAFFQSLYNALRRGAKAVLQFYPSAPEQVHMITRAAMKCGFGGGVVVDYPHSTKAKKYYLVLQAGQVSGGFIPPPGLTGEPEEDEGRYHSEDDDDEDDEDEDEDDEDDDVDSGRTRARVAGRDRERVKRRRTASVRQQKRGRGGARPATGSRDWVLLKKEERRRRGFKTTSDTKYTMRPRKPRF